MKTLSFETKLIFFLFVVIFFIIPPVFSSNPAFVEISFFKFNIFQYLYFFSSILIYILCRKYFLFEEITIEENKNIKKIRFFKNVGISTICFGLLFILSSILEIAAFYLNVSDNVQVAQPEKVLHYLISFVFLLFSSLSEEIIFRYFFPEYLISIFSKVAKSQRTEFIKNLIIELVSAVIFSLGHRYLGKFAVLNAFFAHIILRFCFKKTKCIYYSAIIHFIYNYLIFIFVTIL